MLARRPSSRALPTLLQAMGTSPGSDTTRMAEAPTRNPQNEPQARPCMSTARATHRGGASSRRRVLAGPRLACRAPCCIVALRCNCCRRRPGSTCKRPGSSRWSATPSPFLTHLSPVAVYAGHRSWTRGKLPAAVSGDGEEGRLVPRGRGALGFRNRRRGVNRHAPSCRHLPGDCPSRHGRLAPGFRRRPAGFPRQRSVHTPRHCG